MSAEISIDQSVLKKLKNAMENMISEETKYIRCQLILNICEEFTPENGLSKDLCNKIRSNLILADLDKSSENTDLITQNYNILGINFEKIDNYLTLNDMEVLKFQIKNRLCSILSVLDKKLRKLKSEGLLSHLDNVFSSSGAILTNNKMEIQKSHKKFVCQIMEYNNLLDSNKNLLSDIVAQHVSIYNQMTNYFVNFDKKAALCNLKARILLYKIEQIILSKNSEIFNVLLLLHDDLKKKEETTFDEFNRVTKLLNDYKNLNEEEFKAILKKYDYMKKQIVHLEWTLKEFSI